MIITYQMMWIRIAEFLTDEPRTIRDICQASGFGPLAVQSGLIWGAKAGLCREFGVPATNNKRNKYKRVLAYMRKEPSTSAQQTRKTSPTDS